MSHVSSLSSQLLVAKLGLGLASLAQGGEGTSTSAREALLENRTRVFKAVYDFVVSGVRWYNRSPELYIYWDISIVLWWAA